MNFNFDFTPPTTEEMIESTQKWWAEQKHVNFLDWNEVMLKHTFPLKICSMTSINCEQIINEAYNGRPKDSNVNEQIRQAIEPALVELNCENNFFFKFISRSPKDYLADDALDGKPRALRSIEDATDSIMSSMRCFDDLSMLNYLPEASIVIRPYIDFSAHEEWRVIVENKKIVGISQYYYQKEFSKITNEYAKYCDS